MNTENDVTLVVREYRRVVALLWNSGFCSKLFAAPDWDSVDIFNRVRAILFSSLVVDTIGIHNFDVNSFGTNWKPIESLIVSIEHLPSSIMLNRKNGSQAQGSYSGYWDEVLPLRNSDEISMEFVDFFDFDQIETRHFEYCLVCVKRCIIRPDIEGRLALINSESIKVTYSGD